MGVTDEVPGSPGAELVARLRGLRETVLWKVDGVDEFDLRRPLTPSGTNLLGLVKHLAAVELDYFGDVFDRAPAIDRPWTDHEDENADMWATAEESVDEIVGLYRAAWAHSEATFATLELDATGMVPWWPADRRTVTLGTVLAHVVVETARHLGHIDILREGVDGAVGLRADTDNMAQADARDRENHARRLQQVAEDATGRERS
jgi:uncharacterized damage-inducible protein DinB